MGNLQIEIQERSIGKDISFPRDWVGKLPAPKSRHELRDKKLLLIIKERGLDERQEQEALDYLVTSGSKYYMHNEAGSPLDGQFFHRVCGGGAIVKKDNVLFCSKCGKIPAIVPPEFLRKVLIV